MPQVLGKVKRPGSALCEHGVRSPLTALGESHKPAWSALAVFGPGAGIRGAFSEDGLGGVEVTFEELTNRCGGHLDGPSHPN